MDNQPYLLTWRHANPLMATYDKTFGVQLLGYGLALESYHLLCNDGNRDYDSHSIYEWNSNEWHLLYSTVEAE